MTLSALSSALRRLADLRVRAGRAAGADDSATTRASSSRTDRSPAACSRRPARSRSDGRAAQGLLGERIIRAQRRQGRGARRRPEVRGDDGQRVDSQLIEQLEVDRRDTSAPCFHVPRATRSASARSRTTTTSRPLNQQYYAAVPPGRCSRRFEAVLDDGLELHRAATAPSSTSTICCGWIRRRSWNRGRWRQGRDLQPERGAAAVQSAAGAGRRHVLPAAAGLLARGARRARPRAARAVEPHRVEREQLAGAPAWRGRRRRRGESDRDVAAQGRRDRVAA